MTLIKNLKHLIRVLNFLSITCEANINYPRHENLELLFNITFNFMLYCLSSSPGCHIRDLITKSNPFISLNRLWFDLYVCCDSRLLMSRNIFRGIKYFPAIMAGCWASMRL